MLIRIFLEYLHSKNRLASNSLLKINDGVVPFIKNIKKIKIEE
jgi:hypothetical protein